MRVSHVKSEVSHRGRPRHDDVRRHRNLWYANARSRLSSRPSDDRERHPLRGEDGPAPAVDVGALDSLHFDAANNRTRYDALGKDNGTQVILYAPVNKQLDVDPSSMRCLSFCPICDANGNCDELVDDLDTTGYQEAGLLRLLGNAVRRVRSTGRALGVFQVDDEIFLTPQRGRAR